MTRRLALSALFASLVLVQGCGGGFYLERAQTTPSVSSLLARGAIAEVIVLVDSGMEQDKLTMLGRYDVAGAMRAALVGVGYGPPVYTLQVAIVGFRNGMGPALMRTSVTVLDPSGQPIHAFETSSMSFRGGSKPQRLRRIAQDTVQKIAEGL